MTMNQYSIVEYLDDNSGYKCGYCKNPTSAFSQGLIRFNYIQKKH